LQGKHLFYRRSGADLLQAKSHFEKAVQLDPAYGRAWSALAGVYFVARYENLELPNEMANWREAAERAIALAPDLAEAHVRAAQYQWHAGNPGAAQAHVARALALDPADPLVLGISMADAISEGRLDDATEVQKRITALDPLSATNRGNLGGLLMMVGRLPEAQAEFERAIELSPAGPEFTQNIADVLILQGRTDEALEAISRMPAGFARDQRLALADFARGNASEGDAMLARLLAQAEKLNSDPEIAVAIAELYAAKKDPDRAFEWLDRARLRSVESRASPSWLLHDNLQLVPYLKSLHVDPRWDALLAAVDASHQESNRKAGS
jgi:serine/threonine-protein kinase